MRNDGIDEASEQAMCLQWSISGTVGTRINANNLRVLH